MLEECKVIERIKENKITYKFVKSKTKQREQLGAIQKQDGTFTKCDQEMAEVLNSEFQKVFTKTALLTEELKDSLQNKSGCSDDVKMPISWEETIAAIRSLEEGKAPGPDEVSTSFSLGCEQEMLIPLLIIFNKSYDEGQLPEMWIYANVIPVYKKQKRFENSSSKSSTSFADMLYMQNNGKKWNVVWWLSYHNGNDLLMHNMGLDKTDQ